MFPLIQMFHIGNRWKSPATSQFRYDDEVYGHEIGTCAKNLQYSEPNLASEALICIVESAC